MTVHEPRRRGDRLPRDPWRPIGWLAEPERTPSFGVLPSLTVFLAGAECPFQCVYCDLWQYTLEGPTPPGALTRQLEHALAEAAPAAPAATSLKLYNASNFFESRAVPPGEEALLLPRLEPFRRTVVECHPRLVGERCLRFAASLDGRLEVAMGLETVHPEALPRLQRAMTVDDFDRACDTLLAAGVAVRAFVLLGTPYVPAGEAVEWALRTAAHAFSRGVETVSLIPLRTAELAEHPTEPQIEDAFTRGLAAARGVLQLDLWELERFLPCPSCRAAKVERYRRMNLSGVLEQPIPCAACSR